MSLRQSPRLPRLTDCWSALSHDIVALILDLGILATEQEYEAVRTRFNTAALLMCLNTSSSEAVAMWRQYLPFVYLSNPSSSALRAAARCPRIASIAACMRAAATTTALVPVLVLRHTFRLVVSRIWPVAINIPKLGDVIQ